MTQLAGKQLKNTTITATQLAANAVTDTKLDSTAKQSVLESKRLGSPVIFTAFSAGNSTSAVATDKAVPSSTSKKTNGGASADGIVTTAPNNSCKIREAASNDPIRDGSNRQVFGRLSRTLTGLTGTLTFTNGNATVTGVGTSFTTELVAGDYIQLDSDGTAVKILTVDSNTSLTLTAVYPAPSGSGASSKVVLTLSYFVDIAGVETAHTMSNQTIEVEFQEAFDLFDIPFGSILAGQSFFDLSSAPATTEIVDPFAAENVTVGNNFTGTLSQTPADVSKVHMYVNGIRQRAGAGHDFTVSGTTVSWLATADFNIETTDEVIFVYQV